MLQRISKLDGSTLQHLQHILLKYLQPVKHLKDCGDEETDYCQMKINYLLNLEDSSSDEVDPFPLSSPLLSESSLDS